MGIRMASLGATLSCALLVATDGFAQARNVEQSRFREALELPAPLALFDFGSTGYYPPASESLPGSMVRPLEHRPIRDALERQASDGILNRGSSRYSSRLPGSIVRSEVYTSGQLRPPLRRTPQLPPSRAGRAARQIGAAVLGALGGYYVGGTLGAAIEGDSCNCDDPGLKGYLVGAPVGMAFGALLGVIATR